MNIFIFDQTFDGLLTAVFDAFARRTFPELLAAEGEPLPLFHETVHKVVTTEEKAQRVWKAVEKKLSREAASCLTVCWLSESKDIYMPLFRYICKAVTAERSIETCFTDADVLAVTNMFKKVKQERLRMMQFLRFQKTKDGTYLGVVCPDYDVLPLIIAHFHDRFADQPWLIYDSHRLYGYYFDGTRTGKPTRIEFAESDTLPFDLGCGKLREELLAENDMLFQELWKTYFKAICIQERLNPKKHRKDMPARYWKYMTEKQ
ncbi:MAG: TIGR03915 family putative DNA repair protein [Bacteroides sp.]|nr:TIGR03915 family putative DNA repair protein [Roseburia sp.]MCM1346877.1 TIGR03915 family putative DNA repair protein [Bacteroides sp.]MCM1421420.1 TIGR03915 family putative DNA repair protein [Bacteroides sp.]